MADSSNKRPRRNDARDGNSNKKNKPNTYFKKNYQSLTGIEAGWQGMFATCDRGKEARAVAEMYPILEECALKLYPELKPEEPKEDDDDEDEDIEAAIKRELSTSKDKSKQAERPFVSIKMDAQCVTFFRLKPPLVATEIVQAMCESAVAAGAGSIRSKFIHRLTPVTLTGKATLDGIREVAKVVLAPHFHSGQKGVKFAIRPTSRNHNVLGRTEIINTVAGCVGPDHSVDLKDYDVLILVELYKNICGMSVVKDFEKFKRFNFGQLQIDASQGTESAVPESAVPKATTVNTAGDEAKTENEAKEEVLTATAEPSKTADEIVVAAAE